MQSRYHAHRLAALARLNHAHCFRSSVHRVVNFGTFGHRPAVFFVWFSHQDFLLFSVNCQQECTATNGKNTVSPHCLHCFAIWFKSAQNLVSAFVHVNKWIWAAGHKSNRPWPRYFWKVSRYTSHFYRDDFVKVCLYLGREHYIRHQFESRCASHLYRDAFAEVLGSGVVGTPPKYVLQCFRCPYALRKGKCQYSSHLYHNTPPICIAIHLPFVSQCFWEHLGGCGHRDAFHLKTF